MLAPTINVRPVLDGCLDDWRAELAVVEAEWADSLDALADLESRLADWQERLEGQQAELDAQREELARLDAAADAAQGLDPLDGLECALEEALRREQELTALLQQERLAFATHIASLAGSTIHARPAAEAAEEPAEPRHGDPVLDSVAAQFGKLRRQRADRLGRG